MHLCCRSPHGERGLKSYDKDVMTVPNGRSPHGERGLKFLPPISINRLDSRSPHGERGLKSSEKDFGNKYDLVAPPTGSVD